MSAKSIVKQVFQPRRVRLHSTIKRHRIALAWAIVLGGALLMPTAAAHAQRLRPRGRTTLLGSRPLRRISHRPVDPCKDNELPVADPGPAKAAEVGESVLFDGEASSDPDGALQSYHWDFGDGTPVDENMVTTHVYEAGGEYTVTLTVTDDCGSSSDAAAIVTVSEADLGELRADAGPDRSVRLGEELEFDGTASTGDIIAYQWEFGDGSFGFGPVKTHSYTDTGAYSVTLTIWDSDFNEATDPAEVTV